MGEMEEMGERFLRGRGARGEAAWQCQTAAAQFCLEPAPRSLPTKRSAQEDRGRGQVPHLSLQELLPALQRAPRFDGGRAEERVSEKGRAFEG